MKDERKFVDVVKGIKEREQDVDKLLEAARLQRVEDGRQRLSSEQKFDLILAAILGPLVFALFAMMILGT